MVRRGARPRKRERPREGPSREHRRCCEASPPAPPLAAYSQPSRPLRLTLSVRIRTVTASLALPFALQEPSFRDRWPEPVVVVSRQGSVHRGTSDGTSRWWGGFVT